MKELDKEIMISYDDSVKSHRILFEKLFENGLVPKTESAIKGIMEFFRYTFLEQYPNESGVGIARSMVDALVSCLNSSSYKVVAVASTILRQYINTFDEIPTNCITKLLEALESNVQTSASQVALTLGCIACSKPDIGVLEEIIIPLHDIDFPLCHNCGGSFNRIENADCVIPHLMTHLNRPISRDRNRNVRRACAIALGEIAYTNPESVLNAIQPLSKFLKEEKARDAIIFALGCIGYTRPDLVENFVKKFEEVSKVYYGNIFMACRSALKKIGMETNSLLNHSLSGKRDLETTVDIFFERMKKYDGRLVGESVFALKDLTIKFPEEVIGILNKKIKVSSGCLEQNICRTYDLISKEQPYKLKETMPILVEHFTNRSYGYISINSSASALIRILKNHPELIPKDLEEILITFLKYEKRDSVIHHAKLLLHEIKNC